MKFKLGDQVDLDAVKQSLKKARLKPRHRILFQDGRQVRQEELTLFNGQKVWVKAYQ
jgi:hypothetical protein